MVQSNIHDVRSAASKLLAYCRANQWSGYDPYDALNSRLLEVIPLLDSKIPRLVLTQALKRLPVNVRPWLLIPKTQNAKAMALFLTACRKLAKLGLVEESLVEYMCERLVALRSPGSSYWCWGYSFPWQTRTIIVPRATPNLVCTTFVATSLLDYYEECRDSRWLDIVTDAASYIVNELYWEDGKGDCGFSYPLPGLHSRTHNANFLAAALLCRVYKHTNQEGFLRPALAAARYSAAHQREDGSWLYGEGASQQWIDNFHTGYNLDALRAIDECLGTDEFEPRVERGFEFYRNHFFREDGAPRYFHNRTFPIDVHCIAQSILTPLNLKDLHPGNVALAHTVFRWAMDHMWNEEGFFSYRVLRFCTIRTSYMRWSQAWMLLALSALASESGEAGFGKECEARQTAPLLKTL